MAGYIAHWQCRICKEIIESCDVPKVRVCFECLSPVASVLLAEKFSKARLGDDGIDSRYWVIRAENLTEKLMRRWKNDVA